MHAHGADRSFIVMPLHIFQRLGEPGKKLSCSIGRYILMAFNIPMMLVRALMVYSKNSIAQEVLKKQMLIYGSFALDLDGCMPIAC